MTDTVEQSLATFASEMATALASLTALVTALVETGLITPEQAAGKASPPGKTVVGMAQTTAWYAKHGSVLSKIDAAGGSVPFSTFLVFAKEAGYTKGGYSQIYRKSGLTERTNGQVVMTDKGHQRLVFAKKYLAERGVTI